MDWEAFLAVTGTITGILGGAAAIRRGHRQEDTEAGRQNGVILSELGYIKSAVEDIRQEQREQRKINAETCSRLTAVEASASGAHKRLDKLEERMGERNVE